jgi:D-alanine-D-alanine ligase
VKIALLCNERPERVPAGLPHDAFAEYDSLETLEAITAALEVGGHRVERVPADRRLPGRLEDRGYDFVFNVAEGEGRRCREAIPAAVCELLGLPFTGPDALTLALTLDKALARRAVAPEVRSAPAVLWEGPGGRTEDLGGLVYPVIVKPNDEGSSKGIDGDSIAETRSGAEQRCRRLYARYGCPAIVEEYLPGAEVTVGILGNGADARVLEMMEIEPADPPGGIGAASRFVYSREVKRDYRRRVRYHVPPRLSAETRSSIAALGLAAFRILGCRDAARIDFRLDARGEPFFLECNALPGLDPEDSDLVILSRGRIEYGELIRGILASAARRFSAVETCAS